MIWRSSLLPVVELGTLTASTRRHEVTKKTLALKAFTAKDTEDAEAVEQPYRQGRKGNINENQTPTPPRQRQGWVWPGFFFSSAHSASSAVKLSSHQGFGY